MIVVVLHFPRIFLRKLFLVRILVTERGKHWGKISSHPLRTMLPISKSRNCQSIEKFSASKEKVFLNHYLLLYFQLTHDFHDGFAMLKL